MLPRSSGHPRRFCVQRLLFERVIGRLPRPGSAGKDSVIPDQGSAGERETKRTRAEHVCL